MQSSAFSTPASSAPSTPTWRPQPLDLHATAAPQGTFYALSTSPSGLASDLGMWFADLRREAQKPQKAAAPMSMAPQQQQQQQLFSSRFGGLFQRLWS